jgi:hypothetical protein
MTTPAGEPPTIVAATGPAGPGEQPAPEPAPGPQYLSHRQIIIVLFGVMAGMLLFALDQGIVGTALPRIVSELGGLDKLSWVVTAYLLTATAATPLWGKISDLYGRRLIFQAAPNATVGPPLTNHSPLDGRKTATSESPSPS